MGSNFRGVEPSLPRHTEILPIMPGGKSTLTWLYTGHISKHGGDVSMDELYE